MVADAILAGLMMTLGCASDGSESLQVEPPSAEMLLYLAEFSDSDGQYVDPLALEEVAPEAVAPEAGARAGTTDPAQKEPKR